MIASKNHTTAGDDGDGGDRAFVPTSDNNTLARENVDGGDRAFVPTSDDTEKGNDEPSKPAAIDGNDSISGKGDGDFEAATGTTGTSDFFSNDSDVKDVTDHGDDLFSDDDFFSNNGGLEDNFDDFFSDNSSLALADDSNVKDGDDIGSDSDANNGSGSHQRQLDLNPEQALAHYTDQGYCVINREHREGSLSAETKKMADLIKTALDQLPSHQGVVMRGVSCNIWKWYDIADGNIFSDPGFLSTSTECSVAENFAATSNEDDNFDGMGVMLEITCKKKGKYIQPYAIEDNQHEDEVLFPPFTKFKITKFIRDDNKCCGHIWMTEVVDDGDEVGGLVLEAAMGDGVRDLVECDTVEESCGTDSDEDDDESDDESEDSTESEDDDDDNDSFFGRLLEEDAWDNNMSATSQCDDGLVGVVVHHELPPSIDYVLHMDPESAEAKALEGYTDNDYYDINMEHRAGNLSPETQGKTDLIKAALEMIPSHEGTVFRGVSTKIWQWYDIGVGKVFSDPAFISTSMSKDTAICFAKNSNADEDLSGKGVILEIVCSKGGKFVTPYAVDENKMEDEVLFPPGTKFIIEEVVRNDEEGSGYIKMTEIVDASPPTEEDTTHNNPTTTGEYEAVLGVAPSPGETVPVLPEPQPMADTPSEMGSQWIGGHRRSARLQPQMGTVYVQGLRRSARLAAAASSGSS